MDASHIMVVHRRLTALLDYMKDHPTTIEDVDFEIFLNGVQHLGCLDAMEAKLNSELMYCTADCSNSEPFVIDDDGRVIQTSSLDTVFCFCDGCTLLSRSFASQTFNIPTATSEAIVRIADGVPLADVQSQAIVVDSSSSEEEFDATTAQSHSLQAKSAARPPEAKARPPRDSHIRLPIIRRMPTPRNPVNIAIVAKAKAKAGR